MAVTKQSTRQWRISASQLQQAAQEPGTFTRKYLTADLTRTPRFALILENVTTLPGLFGSTFGQVNKRVITFLQADIEQYLTASGETLPSTRSMFFIPAIVSGRPEDEIVMIDDTLAGSL